mgnify:CR=1 FL=1
MFSRGRFLGYFIGCTTHLSKSWIRHFAEISAFYELKTVTSTQLSNYKRDFLVSK